MDDLTKKHLQDILTAIEEVESFFGNAPKVYDDFKCDFYSHYRKSKKKL